MTAYSRKLDRRSAHAGRSKCPKVLHKEAMLLPVLSSGSSRAASAQQKREIKMATGSVKWPAVTLFWNLRLYIKGRRRNENEWVYFVIQREGVSEQRYLKLSSFQKEGSQIP